MECELVDVTQLGPGEGDSNFEYASTAILSAASIESDGRYTCTTAVEACLFLHLGVMVSSVYCRAMLLRLSALSHISAILKTVGGEAFSAEVFRWHQ